MSTDETDEFGRDSNAMIDLLVMDDGEIECYRDGHRCAAKFWDGDPSPVLDHLLMHLEKGDKVSRHALQTLKEAIRREADRQAFLYVRQYEPKLDALAEALGIPQPKTLRVSVGTGGPKVSCDDDS